MPFTKDELALRWAQASEEEKCEKRRKHAEAQKRYRAKKAKKRSDMDSEEVTWQRALDRKKQSKRRINLTEEEKDAIRAKDRERKAKKRKEKKKDECDIKFKVRKGTSVDLNALEKKKLKQQKYNCTVNKKNKCSWTDEDREKHNASLAEGMRTKRSVMTTAGEMLARIKAKEGMKICRKFGYLRQYKQRKIRNEFDASRIATIGVNRYGFSSLSYYYKKKQEKFVRKYRKNQKTFKMSKSEYSKMTKESQEEMDKKEELKKKNKIRVQRHRKKVKEKLQEPVILEDNSEKGAYELLRENNIQEFERLKKASGLFD